VELDSVVYCGEAFMEKVVVVLNDLAVEGLLPIGLVVASENLVRVHTVHGLQGTIYFYEGQM
jgi:hypothetical protein